MQQSHALSQNSEVIDVWKVALHPPGRHAVACNDWWNWNQNSPQRNSGKSSTVKKYKQG